MTGKELLEELQKLSEEELEGKVFCSNSFKSAGVAELGGEETRLVLIDCSEKEV